MADEHDGVNEQADHTAKAQPSETDLGSQTERMPVSPTEQFPAPEEGDAEAEAGAASLHDVAATAGSYAKGIPARLKVLTKSHVLLWALLALVVIAAVAALTLLVRGMADLPEQELFGHDTQAMLAPPAYSGGAYGHDEALSLADVQLLDRHKEPGEARSCDVRVVAHYTNEHVEALQEALLSYQLTDGTWVCTKAEPVGSASFTAVSGIDQHKLVANVAGILQRAEASRDEQPGSTGLPSLYAGSDVQVVDEAFDAETQSATATLHLTRTLTFTAYECDVQATFSFRPGNGLWELTGAVASANAKEAALTPLVGTWVGSFQGQVAEGGRCFGAKAEGLRVTISSAEGGRIAGTVTGVAHYHQDLAADVESHAGDTVLDGVAFSGSQNGGTDVLSFSCELPDDAAGTVELRLTFGSAADPAAATATLTTRHSYTDTILLFIPYQGEATFSDTFVLTRE